MPRDVDTAVELDRAESALRSILLTLGSAVVAYSGGVDSAVVLAAAVDALGDKALAVTGESASVAQGEVEAAEALARDLGARHEIVQTREFDDPKYLANPANRCFFCKQELFSRLSAIARERGYAWVVDGSNADDGRAALDVRPGQAAGRQLGVRSPLAEAGASKAIVRGLARRWGLAVHDKPATPCLSSRVPHGTAIDPTDLRRIDLAERYLRALGYDVVRVRHWGEVARIEVPLERVAQLSASRQRVGDVLRTIGYQRIEIDSRGYRTGSLNARNASNEM